VRGPLLALLLAAGLGGAGSLVAPRAHGNVLVVVDSAAYMPGGATGSNIRNANPFLTLLQRSLKRGTRMDVHATGGNVLQGPGFTLAELRDSVHPNATDPRYQYDLIVSICAPAVVNVHSPNQLTHSLSLAANRPRVPVLYVDIGAFNTTFVQSSGCSLGVAGNQISLSEAFVSTPAGYSFPMGRYMYKRSTAAAGDYVTPVAWLDFYTFTRADPDGVGGIASPNDTLAAWLYNPPTLSTLTNRNTTGYGCITLENAISHSGASNFPASLSALLAVGMAARLAPAAFTFPASKVALDIDDGGKRWVGWIAHDLQLNDYLAGVDSLNANRIPFTVGMETDSLGALDQNGRTRWANEWAVYGRSGFGKVTVHNHAGTGAAPAGTIADTSLASITGRVYTDVLGAKRASHAFAGNQSIYGLLRGATDRLISFAGRQNVTRHVMPPTDDYCTNRGNIDSVTTAFGMAGYRVVRTQYASAQYNAIGGTGGTGYYAYATVGKIPNAAALAAALGIGGDYSPRVTFVGSQYIYGNTTDTTRADAYGAILNSPAICLSKTWSRVGNYDAATTTDSAPRSLTTANILVSHVPNWRQAQGTGAFMSGSRPAWESVRMVHGAMEAARWCALQANTSTRTYFRDGPVKWVWSDEFGPADIR
jgi:hypothetical protein